jgi:hypothetical protein
VEGVEAAGGVEDVKDGLVSVLQPDIISSEKIMGMRTDPMVLFSVSQILNSLYGHDLFDFGDFLLQNPLNTVLERHL